MAESLYSQCGDVVDWTADAAYSAGAIVQLPDGRAGQVTVDCDSGALVGVRVKGVLKSVAKTTSMVVLDGGEVYWDHSADKAHYKQVNDKDFYLGRAVGDAASADTTMAVELNRRPTYKIDVSRDACVSVISGTAAAGGFGYPVQLGGANVLELTATSEVQKVDLMSVDGFAIAANPIVEFAFRVISDGSGSAPDFTIGAASGTHATDFQSVAEFVTLHLDGNATAINAESDDGTTDVGPTDTTLTYTEGSGVTSRVEGWLDFRNPSDVQVYVNGALVLGATVFTLAAATGPLYLIAHLEKTTGTDTYKVAVDWLRVRTQQ